MNFFPEKQVLFENYLREYAEEQGSTLTEAMNYSLLAGGKRLRPLLFLAAAAQYQEDVTVLLPFALGIEMIHTYSLVHDDLPAMDNDDFRRGKATNHKVYGEAMAILAGDSLLTEAFFQMTQTKAEPESLVKAMALVSDYAGKHGMVYGQTLDIAAEGKEITLEALKEIHYYKTGKLITLSLLSGAILAGAPKEHLAALESYGENLGLAFQITDDILDVEGSFEALGKPIGSDADSAKTTYVTLLGIEGAKKAAKDAIYQGNTRISQIVKDYRVFQRFSQALLTRTI